MFFATLTVNYQECRLCKEHESTSSHQSQLHNGKSNKTTHRFRSRRNSFRYAGSVAVSNLCPALSNFTPRFRHRCNFRHTVYGRVDSRMPRFGRRFCCGRRNDCVCCDWLLRFRSGFVARRCCAVYMCVSRRSRRRGSCELHALSSAWLGLLTCLFCFRCCLCFRSFRGRRCLRLHR